MVTKGSFFLELAGGEEFLEPLKASRTVNLPGIGKITSVWEQHQYDPVSALTDYSLHFKLPGGRWLNDAFTYHWRIWGIRDVRETLRDAGFKKTVVLWEKGEGSGHYVPQAEAPHSSSWVAYIVAVR